MLAALTKSLVSLQSVPVEPLIQQAAGTGSGEIATYHSSTGGGHNEN